MTKLQPLAEFDEIINNALNDIKIEMLAGVDKFGEFHSYHESYGVLLEETDELWNEIKQKEQNIYHINHESLQVSAIALRIYLDSFKHVLKLTKKESDKTEDNTEQYINHLKILFDSEKEKSV